MNLANFLNTVVGTDVLHSLYSIFGTYLIILITGEKDINLAVKHCKLMLTFQVQSSKYSLHLLFVSECTCHLKK